MPKNNYQETVHNNEIKQEANSIGAYMYVMGTYANSTLTTSFGVYPATLSPKGIVSLQAKKEDLSKPTLMMVVPVTKPEVSEYNYAGKQKPYLGFIVEEVNPVLPLDTPVGNLVKLSGKVINEKRRYEFVLIKVYYPFMLTQYSIIKLNGILEGYGNAIDNDYEVEAQVEGNELVIVRSRQTSSNTIQLEEYSVKSVPPRRRRL